MRTKLKDVVLSVLKENGDVDEKDVVFLFDKKSEKEDVLWGFGIRGMTHIGSHWMNKIHLNLWESTDNNDGKYRGITDNSTPGYTFKYGYGIIFFRAQAWTWNFQMKDQEKEWRDFNFYEKEPSCIITNFLSRLFCRNNRTVI